MTVFYSKLVLESFLGNELLLKLNASKNGHLLHRAESLIRESQYPELQIAKIGLWSIATPLSFTG